MVAAAGRGSPSGMERPGTKGDTSGAALWRGAGGALGGVLLATIFVLPLCAQTTSYEVSLADPAAHRFEVSVRLQDLTPADSVFQFAATAPGTYQVMDIGRWVSDFHAFDANGVEVPTRHASVDRWSFARPTDVTTVRYAVADTWNTSMRHDNPYPMCGTSLDADHALVNGEAVFGYPERRQDLPVRVRFHRPADWKVGTALVADSAGWYAAEDYDQLVDSPFLMGRLTGDSLRVDGVPVQVWVYSRTGRITAARILSSMRSTLEAAATFLGGLPVDRYAFLWDLDDRTAGAWEHNFSSEYVVAEPPAWSESFRRRVLDMATHEFFHVVTPLNIHSEIIEHFNFETPTPSQHLWLYEGVTEWASGIMQLRTHLVTLPQYLARILQKIRVDRNYYDPRYSLREMSLTSYSDSGQAQYADIYQRGALVAGLLDIRLLELSGGKQGLRELVLELASRYGKARPFPEDGLFDVITEMTYPEIGDFFDRYVEHAEPLPLVQYWAKVGLRFVDGPRPRFEIMRDATPEQVALRRAWLSLHPEVTAPSG